MVNQNIKELVSLIIEEMSAQGYGKGSLKCERKILNRIARFHEQNGKEQYDPDVLADYVRGIDERYENGNRKRGYYKSLKCTVRRMKEFSETGKITWCVHVEMPKLSAFYESLLKEYKVWDGSGNKNYYLGVRRYFVWLLNEGHINLSSVDTEVIRKYMLYCAEHLSAGSLSNTKLFLKRLYVFLKECDRSPSAYELLLSFPVNVEQKIQKAVPQSEVAAILSAIDRSTLAGKRDYAMLMLGTVTGLRAVDIMKLKFSDIDWRNGEIRIIQSKTSKALTLPLTTDVGEAVKDYIINGRPQSDAENIFLRLNAPYTGCFRGSMVGIYNRNRNRAGLSNGKFHDMRRAAGLNMITSGVSVTVVAQALGHTNIDSTKPYIALDSDHLRECALDFSGMAPENYNSGKMFISAMAPSLEAFFEYRNAMGYSRNPYDRILKQFDRFCANRYPDLETPDKNAVLQWWEELSTGKYGNSNIKAGAIRTFCKYMNAIGKDAYLLPTSFVSKRTSFTAYLFTDDELKSFFHAVDSLSSEQETNPFMSKAAPVLFRLLYTCGLRPNEVRNLKKSDINWETGEVLITGTKRRKDRIVVMSGDMLDFCKDYDLRSLELSGNDELFFPQPDGTPYSERKLRDLFKRCWRMANPDIKVGHLPKVRPYDLRHRFASAILQKWLDEGRDLYAMLPYLRAYMGHKDLSATAYYIHILPENLLKSPGVDWDRLDRIAPEVEIWSE